MRQTFSVLLAFALFLFSVPAQASPWALKALAPPPEDNVSMGAAGATIGVGKISPMNKGEKAPFDGVLLDAAAAARVMVNQQEAEAKCQIEVEKEVATAEAKLELDLANLRASNEALEKELEVRTELKDEHIEFLEKEVGRNAKKANNGKWWLIGGVAIGIALTIGGAFVIREIRTDQPIIVNNGM